MKVYLGYSVFADFEAFVGAGHEGFRSPPYRALLHLWRETRWRWVLWRHRRRYRPVLINVEHELCIWQRGGWQSWHDVLPPPPKGK